MIDFGGTPATAVHIGFGTVPFGAPSSMSFLFRARMVAAGNGGGGDYDDMIAMYDQLAVKGWTLAAHYVSPNWIPRFGWFNGSTGTVVESTGTWAVNEWATWCIVWGGPGGTTYFYKNGVAAGSPANSANGLVDSGRGLAINSIYDGYANPKGGPLQIDNVTIYPNYSLTQDDAKDFHNGVFPHPEKAQFWFPGEYAPGYNVLKTASGGQEQGTNRNGTPTVVEVGGPFTWSVLRPRITPFFSAEGEASAPASPQGLMAAAMLEEVKVGGRRRAYFALELDLPNGETVRRSSESLPTDDGHYELGVESWGPISKRADVLNLNIEKLSTSVSVVDRERALARLLGGELDALVEGSPARVKLISPYVPSSDWFTVFSGQLLRWGSRGSLPVIDLELGPNDKPLQGGAKLGVIDGDLFADAGSDVVGTPIQAVYGIHAASGGAVDAIRVSTTEWLVSAGWLPEITEVYENGAVTTKSWSRSLTERKGRRFTEVKFTSDPGDIQVTVDVKGIESFGDGSGATITNPADQLLHALVNWYFGAYQRGDWLTAADVGAPLHTGHFGSTAQWMAQYGWMGKRVITESKTGYQLINEWVASWRIPVVFWTFDGRLAVRVPRFLVSRASQPRLTEADHALGPLRIVNQDEKLRDEIVLKHGYVEAGGSTSQETRAKDVSRDYGVAESVTHYWSTD